MSRRPIVAVFKVNCPDCGGPLDHHLTDCAAHPTTLGAVGEHWVCLKCRTVWRFAP